MTSDDRDSTTEGITVTGWTEEKLAAIAAEELASAMAAHGIGFRSIDPDGLDVDVMFSTLRDAETMLTLAVDGTGGAGSLYDRATSGCLTTSDLARQYGDDVPLPMLEAAFRVGWDWMIHPDMIGRRMGWHVSVTMPHGDANAITATLNAVRNVGGAK